MHFRLYLSGKQFRKSLFHNDVVLGKRLSALKFLLIGGLWKKKDALLQWKWQNVFLQRKLVEAQGSEVLLIICRGSRDRVTPDLLHYAFETGVIRSLPTRFRKRSVLC